MPTLYTEIITRIIEEQPDMLIVGEPYSGRPILEAVERADPDVLLAATVSGDSLWPWPRMVREHPWLHVLALDVGGRQNYFLETRYDMLPTRRSRKVGNGRDIRLLRGNPFCVPATNTRERLRTR
jgi:hypothetical protein